ncbi:MAG: metal-sensing transcriptional repressor [Clostridia bacterium]|nr:metal-sensing transcriptional repressor [Clostridia bacterium]
MNKNEPACPLCAAPSDGSDARRTERSEEVRRKLTNRLSRIEGQIRGIRQMIENDAYCNDVLIQSAAAGAALNAFNRALIGCHMRSCVARDLREGNDAVIDELLDTLEKLMK